MRLFIVFLVIGCFVAANVYGLAPEEKNRLIKIYNFTADQYKVIIGLFEDLNDSRIDTRLAEEKVAEWKERYHELTQDLPPETEEMCGLMTEILDTCEELFEDYRPNHRKTKDLLKELEELKTAFITAMTELKYELH